MSSHDRRAAARRRAWGRGPAILRFEPLEGRQLLSGDSPLAVDSPEAVEVSDPVIIPLQTDAPPADDVPVTVADAVADDAGPTPSATTTAPDVEPVIPSQIVTVTSTDAPSESAETPPATTPDDAAPGAEPTETPPATTPDDDASGAEPTETPPAPAPTIPDPQEVIPVVPTMVDPAMPDLRAASFATPRRLDWGDPFHAVGSIQNQGDAPTGGFRVDVVAARPAADGDDEVRLGSIEFPDGLAAGESRTFDLPAALPTTPIPAVDAQSPVTIRLRVDAANAVAESDEGNNSGRGHGLDTADVTIVPRLPARLVGAAFNVSPGPLAWGDTIVVTTQIRNDAQGNAPATRARIVLTPVGQTPGGPSDVTISSLPIPALPAAQAATVTRTIVLPAAPPSTLAGSSQFVISILTDADHQISPLVARPALQGLGRDAATITIAPRRTPTPVRNDRPDLTTSDVQVSADALTWGDSFQVSANLRNAGRAGSEAVRVRFLLAGADGATDSALVLGDATVGGLRAGAAQGIAQAVQLPRRLPEGLMPTGPITGRIVVQVDPENTIDEANETNNTAVSAPIVLRLLSADGTRTVVTSANTPAATPAGSTPIAPPPAAIPAGTATTPADPSPATIPLPLPVPPAAPTTPTTSGSVSAQAATAVAPTVAAQTRRQRLAARRQLRLEQLRARRQRLRLFPGGGQDAVRPARRRP